jgi:hypothetical protein
MSGTPPVVPPGPGPGGGSTTTSTSTTSSTTSAPAAPNPNIAKNAIASYLNLLAGWGITVTPEVEAFVKHAVGSGWGSSYFLQQVRLTQFYQQAFPGILRQDGTPRMSEAQYVSFRNQVKSIARQNGRNLNDQQIGFLLKQGVSASEFQTRLRGLNSLDSNRDMLDSYNNYLLTTGVINKPLSRSDLFKFVMGEAPKEWEQQWQIAYSSGQLANIGITVGRPSTGSDISYKQLGRLENRFEALNPGQEVENLGQDFYAKLAEAAKSIPISKLYGAGVTKKDIVALGFGGKRAPEIADRVQRVLATYGARFEPQVEPQLYSSGMAGGAEPVQSTE